MLDIKFGRRDFLRIGTLSLAGTTLRADDEFHTIEDGGLRQDKAVIFVWLGGGCSQFETFHANADDVDDKFISVSDTLFNSRTGMRFGGDWTNLFEQCDKCVAVNSFGHGDSSHLQATHQMISGQYNKERTQTAAPMWPSHGSVISSVYGPNNAVGVPTYVQQGVINGDGAAWLGSAYRPFDPSRRENLIPQTEVERFQLRFRVLDMLDRRMQGEEMPESWTEMKRQAYSAIVGEARAAFEIEKEPEHIREMYGEDTIGKQLLMARRLVEYGTKFVTVHYGGWDMHSNIQTALTTRVPPIDRALSALIKDIWDQGLNKEVLVIVTSEFGRTMLNANSGRDHWPRLTTLLMSGGDYEMGRVIGKNDKAYEATEDAFKPIDLACTIFDHFGISKTTQRTDSFGRPRYLLEHDANHNLRSIL